MHKLIMDKNWDVLVVSAHDRSFWLVDQLNRKDLKVGVCDVSSRLPLSLSERQGPLGKFIPERLKDSQKQYLYGDQYTPLKNGFCILTPTGSLEFKGPLTEFLLKTRTDMRCTHQHLKENKNPLAFLKKKPSESWILKLVAGLQGQSFYSDSALSLKSKTLDSLISKIKQWIFPWGACLPTPFPSLFSEYIMGQASLKYFQEVHQLFQQRGVRYVSQIHIKNINPGQKNTKSGNLSFRFLIWTLSRQETKRLFPSWLSFLFPDWPAPCKIWRRTPLIWNQGVFKDIVPPALILASMPEVSSPPALDKEDTDGEFYSLKKISPSRSDLWMLHPYSEDTPAGVASTNRLLQQNPASLPLFKKKAVKFLKQCMPTMHFEIKTNTDFENEYFVLYKQKRKLKKTFPHGVFHLNPEGAGGFDNGSLLRQAEKILLKILKERAAHA